MQTVCRFSALPLSASAVFADLPHLVFSHHPIFDFPLESIIQLSTSRAKLSPDEKRLIFIAFLQKSPLFTFRCPAVPSDELIETHFVNALALHSGIDQNNAGLYPHFVVDRETANLANFATFIKDVAETRPRAKTSHIKPDLFEAADKERLIAATIAEQSNDQTISPKLANWAIRTLNDKARKGLTDWNGKHASLANEIFKTKTQKISTIRNASLYSLRILKDYFADFLPADDNSRMRTAMVIRNLQSKIDALTKELASITGQDTIKHRETIAGIQYSMEILTPFAEKKFATVSQDEVQAKLAAALNRIGKV